MPLISGQLALATAAQRLSNMYGGGSLGNVVNPIQDVPLRQVLIRAAGATAYLGQDANVTASVYGTDILTTALVAERIGPFDTGGIKLSDIWVAGSGSTVHVTGVVF